jgi:hypothetical protein
MFTALVPQTSTVELVDGLAAVGKVQFGWGREQGVAGARARDEFVCK